jgi:pilus assembly protein Flp/PilA
LIRRFLGDERGATAIEYALIVGIMSMAVIAIAATGGALDNVYEKVSEIVDAIGGGDDDDG